MDLGLQGQLIVRQEYGYTDLFETDRDFEIRIENDYTLRVAGEVLNLSPEHFDPDSEPPNVLLDHTVASSVVEADGTLNIGFDNGNSMRVGPHKTYEAWTLAGPHGHKVVCMPGGKLAIWQPENRHD